MTDTSNRIADLLNRAGYPDAQEITKRMAIANPEMHNIWRSRLLNYVDEHFDGSMAEYVRHLTGIIESLVDVLENVLNERDALLEEMPERCHLCAHSHDGISCDVPMNERGRFPECKCWKWRGPQTTKEETNDVNN